jgi:hypothetical protein
MCTRHHLLISVWQSASGLGRHGHAALRPASVPLPPVMCRHGALSIPSSFDGKGTATSIGVGSSGGLRGREQGKASRLREGGTFVAAREVVDGIYSAERLVHRQLWVMKLCVLGLPRLCEFVVNLFWPACLDGGHDVVRSCEFDCAPGRKDTLFSSRLHICS